MGLSSKYPSLAAHNPQAQPQASSTNNPKLPLVLWPFPPCLHFALQTVALGAPGVMVTPTTEPAAEAMPGGRKLKQVRCLHACCRRGRVRSLSLGAACLAVWREEPMRSKRQEP